MAYTDALLPERISALMKAQEPPVTQNELAKVLMLPQQAISLRLLGKRPFTVRDLCVIANHYQVKPGELLAGPDVLFTEGL